MESNCEINGCANTAHTKNMCSKHYTRSVRNGNPFVSLRARDGRSKHPLYKKYKSMKNRCYNKADPAYKWYGLRGIKVCDKWLGENGFWNFVEDMGNMPSSAHSIDRTNNHDGYSPENCRWANSFTQAINTRSVENAQGFTVRKRGKFRARIRLNGLSKHLGDYGTKKEAIEAYKTARKARESKLMEGKDVKR